MAQTLNSLGLPSAQQSGKLGPIHSVTNTRASDSAEPISASVGDSLFRSDRSPLRPIPKSGDGELAVDDRLETNALGDSLAMVSKIASRGGDINPQTAYMLSLANRASKVANSEKGPGTAELEAFKGRVFTDQLALRAELRSEIDASKGKNEAAAGQTGQDTVAQNRPVEGSQSVEDQPVEGPAWPQSATV